MVDVINDGNSRFKLRPVQVCDQHLVQTSCTWFQSHPPIVNKFEEVFGRQQCIDVWQAKFNVQTCIVDGFLLEVLHFSTVSWHHHLKNKTWYCDLHISWSFSLKSLKAVLPWVQRMITLLNFIAACCSQKDIFLKWELTIQDFIKDFIELINNIPMRKKNLAAS